MKKHEDERGIIEDLKVGKDWSVTYITFKKGAVRGNHYHKETHQQDILISGCLDCYSSAYPGQTKKLDQGCMIEHFKGEAHAYKALEDSILLSICFGKRIGENYEEDTFRLLESEKLL